MTSREAVRVVYQERADLEKAWRLYIKHGALVARVHPPPAKGERRSLILHPVFGGDDIHMVGLVAQASPSTTVFQLEPLDIAARGALVLAGIADAAPEPSFAMADEHHEDEEEEVEIAATIEQSPAPTIDPPEALAALPPQPVAEPVAEPAPPPAPEPVAAAPVPEPVPEPVPVPPAPAPEPPREPVTPARALSHRALKPVRQRGTGSHRRPVSQARIQVVPEPTAGPAPAAATVDAQPGHVDASAIANLSGPVAVETEVLLPPQTSGGNLGEDNWRDVLMDLYVGKATGLVVIHAFRENRWCYLVDGSPVHYLVDHAHPGEYLADALMRDGAVSGKQWTEALSASKLAGVPPGEVLVRRRTITEAQLHKALQERAAAITRNLLTANFGSWSYHPWPPVRELQPWKPVDLLPLLLRVERATMKRLSDEEITKETEPHLDLHTSLNPVRRNLLAELPLNDQERVLVDDLLPGGWTIKELLVYGGMREKELLRFVWVLRSMGFVLLSEDEGPNSKRNRAERTLFVALKDITRRSDFEALHCHWTAVQIEVESGHAKILQEFGAQRFAAVLDARLEELIGAIRIRADEALASVGSKAGRDALRRNVIGESQLIMGAELMLKQADMELYKSNFAVAKVCYQRVLELAPPIPETRDARDRAKGQLASPALQSLEGAASVGRMMAVGAAIDEQLKG